VEGLEPATNGLKVLSNKTNFPYKEHLGEKFPVNSIMMSNVYTISMLTAPKLPPKLSKKDNLANRKAAPNYNSQPLFC
jgi:hypothetical protein